MKNFITLIIISIIFVVSKPAILQSQSSQEEDLKNFGLLSEVNEHHQLLYQLAGDWKVNFVNYHQDETISGMGESKSQIIYNGRYLEIKNSILVQGSGYESTTLIGYDNRKEKYILIAYDNSTNYPTTFSGTYDAVKKQFTFIGRDYMIFLKKEVEIKIELTVDRENKFTSKFYYSDTKSPTLAMEIVYIKK